MNDGVGKSNMTQSLGRMPLDLLTQAKQEELEKEIKRIDSLIANDNEKGVLRHMREILKQVYKQGNVEAMKNMARKEVSKISHWENLLRSSKASIKDRQTYTNNIAAIRKAGEFLKTIGLLN